MGLFLRMNKKATFFLLFSIVIIASVLRLYKLGSIPPSISWDEAAVGYNAYTIAHWGRDEWGRVFPLIFKSFEDYKNPVHVYATVPFVGLFGLSELTTRLSAALFGIGNVILIYFLATVLFNSSFVGIIASFVLAISPYNIQFSRFNHELNFAVFFFSLGLLFFLKAIKGNSKLLIASFFCFGIDLLTYQSAKVVTPPLVLFLILLNLKDLLRTKRMFLASFLTYLLFVSLFFIEPELLGTARLRQNTISEGAIEGSYLYERSSNYFLGLGNVVFDRYKLYFQNDFLFDKGDSLPRHSAQIVGTFYKIDGFFLVIGLISLLVRMLRKRDKYVIFLIAWAVIAPLPAAATSSFAHAARAMFMTISWHLVVAYGVYSVAMLLRRKLLVGIFLVLIFLLMTLPLGRYVKYYFEEYPEKYAIEWQYGMKQIVEYMIENPDYYKVYVDKERHQPYIFFLFYLKYPLPDFLATVKYDKTESKSYNAVLSFDRYQFGGWNWIESYPANGIAYILEPSKYTGLRFMNDFSVAKLIKYPNRENAFYVLAGEW